jgi:hypothetical protein
MQIRVPSMPGASANRSYYAHVHNTQRLSIATSNVAQSNLTRAASCSSFSSPESSRTRCRAQDSTRADADASSSAAGGSGRMRRSCRGGGCTGRQQTACGHLHTAVSHIECDMFSERFGAKHRLH